MYISPVQFQFQIIMLHNLPNFKVWILMQARYLNIRYASAYSVFQGIEMCWFWPNLAASCVTEFIDTDSFIHSIIYSSILTS